MQPKQTHNLFLKVLLQACFIVCVSAADITDISRLRHQILDNYDKHARPVQNLNETILVKISFLNNGFEIDEKRNMLTLHLLTVLVKDTWDDSKMKWDPITYGNLSEITFDSNELWKPEISVINNFDESEIYHFGNSLMIGTPNGEVWWLPPSKFQVHCQYDFRLWPYDKQSCRVILSSWTYHGGEIDWEIRGNHTYLIIDPTWQEHFLENREWKLLGSNVTRFSKVVYCCPPIPIVELLITVDVQRRSSAHTVAITVVGLGIATAVLISFWLDPFAQERLPMTLLVLLLNSIYLQHLHRIIPNNGDTVPLSSSVVQALFYDAFDNNHNNNNIKSISLCFFRDSLIMVTFAFGWTVGIRYLAKTKRCSPLPLPGFIEKLLNSLAATVLCLTPRPQTKGHAQRKLEETTDEEDVSELVGEGKSDAQEDWEWLARLLDRIVFLGYLTTYIFFIAAFL